MIIETPVEIMLATLIVCYGFSRQRLSIIIPYALIASRLTSPLEWAAVTVLLFVFALFDKVIAGVMHD